MKIVLYLCMEKTVGKIYKTIVTVEVLSSEPIETPISLREIDYQITDGLWSGQVEIGNSTPFYGLDAVNEIKEQGSDPDFFALDMDGNDYQY